MPNTANDDSCSTILEGQWANRTTTTLHIARCFGIKAVANNSMAFSSWNLPSRIRQALSPGDQKQGLGERRRPD